MSSKRERAVIKIENLSKAYQIGQFGTGTISRDIERWWVTRVRKQDDPYLKIGETNDRTTKGSSDIVWSLRDLNFEINQGDAVGIIGKNGAGKSTLLKILSRVTAPTSGSFKVRGRIASLLEVGTGFHPELTGRENIYLNGAILGMRKKEITRNLDEIIDFSGVERYIDTPVKRYSSGMYVRLAFAVAAHLESEILIVDEVLAVGDAEFQKKCLGKMRDVSKGEGRTILFVSHNMIAIQKLCIKGLFLRNGNLVSSDNIDNVINQYLEIGSNNKSEFNYSSNPNDNESEAFVKQIRIEDENGNLINEISLGKKWFVKIKVVVNKSINDFIIGLGMLNNMETNVRTSWQKPFKANPGVYLATFEESELQFSTGRYKFQIGLSSNMRSIQFLEDDIYFQISDVDNGMEGSILKSHIGVILNQMKMHVEVA